MQKTTIAFSFLAGIPLGAMVSYLWLVAMEVALALVVLFLVVVGVMGSAYIYTKSHIIFHQADAGP